MRLKADLQVCDRSVTSTSRTNTRHALISLGRKPDNEDLTRNELKLNTIYLMLNTAKDNKSGTTYDVTKSKKSSNKNATLNVEIFDRFANEGKATIRFAEPSHDLSLTNADPILLKTFLNVLKVAHQLPIDSKQFSTLNPVCKRQIKKEATNLTISERNQYPSKEAGFPHTLNELILQQLSLKKIDARIFHLTSLVTLDLSGNAIKEVPTQLTSMPSLKCLDLANNKIEYIPTKFSQNVRFCRQLVKLNMERNHLTRLPNNLTNFTSMLNLNLKNNFFSHLPRGLFQKMTNLRALDISGCKYLISLPTTFFDTKRMDSLFASDLPKIFSRMDSRNYASACHQDGVIDTTTNIPSLFDISCKTVAETKILKNKLLEENVLLPLSIMEYINTLVRCYCQKICLPSSCLIKVLRFRVDDVMKFVTRDLTTDQPNGSANFECIFCSHNCNKMFLKSLNLLPN